MSQNTEYDVIVIGGGAIGLAAAYEVAKSGKSILVLEQSNFFNQSGSSGDIIRMYRTMYTEDYMANLAKKSMKNWTDLEQDAGDGNLRLMSGLLNFGDPKYGAGGPEGTLMGPVPNLERLGMRFEKLHVDDIESRYPFKNLPRNYIGLLAPDNGCINVTLLLRTLYRLAFDYGAKLLQRTGVTKVEPAAHNKDIWHVHTKNIDGEKKTFSASKLIITCGAYSNHVVTPSFGFHFNFEIWEMTATYFNVSPGPRGTNFPSMWFQFAEDVDKRSQLFYGFPAVPWGPPNLCRISVDAATNIINDPNERSSSVISHEDIEDTRQWVEKHVVGVDATVPATALTCLQTNVFDNMFVLDYVPDRYLNGGASKSVAVFAAGWAMKFTPLLGLALKQMVLDGGSDYALKHFSIERKSEDGKQTIISDGPLDVVDKASKPQSSRRANAGGSSVKSKHSI